MHSLTPDQISLIGYVPVAAMFAAQWRNSDELWLVCNVLFLLYHTFLTQISSLAVCAALLSAICVVRILRKVRSSEAFK